MINPTGGKVRKDLSGDGRYGASRGSRRHGGVDHCGNPGQDVVYPISGTVVRLIRVYADTAEFSGVEIRGDKMTVRVLYVSAPEEIVGKRVVEGQVIGPMQDVTRH